DAGLAGGAVLRPGGGVDGPVVPGEPDGDEYGAGGRDGGDAEHRGGAGGGARGGAGHGHPRRPAFDRGRGEPDVRVDVLGVGRGGGGVQRDGLGRDVRGDRGEGVG